MSTDPTPRDKAKLDELARAVTDACRSTWTIYHLKDWDEIARAPSDLIKEALDTAYRLGATSREPADDEE